MIYPSDFELKIDFDTIRERLDRMCLTPMGKDECRGMRFHTSYEKIKQLLKPVEETALLERQNIDLPMDSIKDLAHSLAEISVRGTMVSMELASGISAMLRLIQKLIAFDKEDVSEKAPEIHKIISRIPQLRHISDEINRIIDKNGEVRPDASPELSAISDRIIQMSGAMGSIVRNVIRQAAAKGIVEPDTTPSIREGRAVIPVPAMSKRSIPGIVHDQSASGRTYFIEPTEAVESGNRLRTLEIERQKEIAKILTALADFIRPEIPELKQAIEIIGKIDFIKAKAKFAVETDAYMPNLRPHPELEWYHAIHPVLLESLRNHDRTPVPLDITLNKDRRILVISGPNAGGKSVALKTVGIVQYMLQCGLLPPLHSNSHMGIFRNLLIDIGDEQSMQNDLSTYSSHLRNMKFFVTHSDSKTLFLADEIGSGTEPQIGSALAQSILKRLGETGAWGIVTTHYQNLKTFAESEPSFENAAMLYDRTRLQPLFMLSIGNPGSSFALEIARKAGIPAALIDNAKDIVGSDYVNMDKYLLDLTRDRKYWAEKRNSIKQKEQRLDSLLEQSSRRAEIIKASRADIINEARREAKEIMKGANASIEKAIREIREVQAEKERTKEIRRQLAEYSGKLEQEKVFTPKILNVPQRKLQDKKTNPNIKPKTKKLEPGDYVRMQASGVTGRILSINGNKAEVAFGALRTITSLESLSAASKPKPSNNETSLTKETTDASRNRQLSFSRELDVRGMRVDEALQAVTYFLDDARQFNASGVRILHGTGTGALRQAIREYLPSVPGIMTFHDEDVRFGGAGITVIDLE